MASPLNFTSIRLIFTSDMYDFLFYRYLTDPNAWGAVCGHSTKRLGAVIAIDTN